MTVYDLLIDFTLASVLILLGQLLRAKITLFQKLFVPPSMIAGFLGLALGSQGVSLLPFSSSIGAHAGVLIILIFTIVGINGFTIGGKGGAGAELKRAYSYNNYRFAIYFLQFFFPIAVTLILCRTVLPQLNPGFGVLMASGFTGGHGTAAAVGRTFETLGWKEATDLGMTFATIGILTGVFGGLAWIKWATKNGYAGYVKDFKYISADMRTGLVAKENRISIGDETISPVSLDTLCYHLALVLGIGGLGYMLNSKVLAPHVLAGIPDFTVAYILAILFFLTFRKTGIYEHFDTRISSKISGTCTDYLVFFGIASIRITIIIKYMVPVLILMLCGFICVFLTIVPLGCWMNNNSWFERSIFCYGYSTGVFATGFILLRIVDPENKSKTVEDIALTPFLNFCEIAVWSTIPAALLAGKGWYVVGITGAIFVIAIALSVFGGCWYMTPLKERKAIGINGVEN